MLMPVGFAPTSTKMLYEWGYSRQDVLEILIELIPLSQKTPMYLAPLNYDRFFKKVFSDLNIAKKFLEDFLDIEIEEIHRLKSTHRVTDDATLVEFDYRCKINGAYVIIDMQQWYKPDVVHRFYIYHSLGTVLQLEELPLKSIIVNPKTKEEKTIKDYRSLEPVITIVWMVDETFKQDDDFLSFAMYPDDVAYFLKNSDLWNEKHPIKNLLEDREQLLAKLNNTAKNLNFLQSNRLIFAFQRNIIKNKKIKAYLRWFALADKTRSKDNEKEDFVEFEQDADFLPIYQEIRRRLIRKNLESNELEYITEEGEKQARLKRSIDGYIAEKDIEVNSLHDELKETKQALEQKDQALEQKDQALEQKDHDLLETKQALEQKDHDLLETKQTLEQKDQALEQQQQEIEALRQQLEQHQKP